MNSEESTNDLEVITAHYFVNTYCALDVWTGAPEPLPQQVPPPPLYVGTTTSVFKVWTLGLMEVMELDPQHTVVNG